MDGSQLSPLWADGPGRSGEVYNPASNAPSFSQPASLCQSFLWACACHSFFYTITFTSLSLNRLIRQSLFNSPRE
ncbi:hypothetical protein BDV12DRAFT_165420 [Aspergillus spectabilis]